MGKLFDNSCELWREGCDGNNQHCFVYSSDNISVNSDVSHGHLHLHYIGQAVGNQTTWTELLLAISFSVKLIDKFVDLVYS